MLKSIFKPYVFALLAPSILLGGAYFSQYGYGLQPCEMCYWQRWPHMAAIALALAGLLLQAQPLGRICVYGAALAIAISGAIGVFHAGVEYNFWEGLTDCSTLGGMEPGSILRTTLANSAVRCDEAQLRILGISLAGFNALFSFAAAGFILLGLRRESTQFSV
jgi:disulfide bond formation protein DsbB